MKLAIVTDAWLPQVNGVVTTLQRTRDVLEAWGHAVAVLSPDQFPTVPCPTYPEIRLALLPGRRVAALLDRFENVSFFLCEFHFEPPLRYLFVSFRLGMIVFKKIASSSSTNGTMTA